MEIKQPLFVCIEGNVGSGKTSLMELFKDDDNCKVFYEPVDAWQDYHKYQDIEDCDCEESNMLKNMYVNPKKNIFKFQAMALETFLQREEKMREEKSGILLSERSTMSAQRVFIPFNVKKGNLSKCEKLLLGKLELKSTISAGVFPDLIVYIKTTPEIALERIKKRNREGEENLGEEDLLELDELYDEYIDQIKESCKIPIYRIDGDKSLNEINEFDVAELRKIMNKMEKKKNKKANLLLEDNDRTTTTADAAVQVSQQRGLLWDYVVTTITSMYNSVLGFILRRPKM